MKPILFSDAMIRAILDGRKCQTRRIVKPQPVKNNGFWELYGAGWSMDSGSIPCIPGHSLSTRNPYGQTGDLLWVRETYASNIPGCESQGGYCYKADQVDPRGDGPANPIKWKPYIFMPREASRITLKITDLRVERVQDISEEDAKAEGAPLEKQHNPPKGFHPPGLHSYRFGFYKLWKSINGSESWERNDWVWVISFERV